MDPSLVKDPFHGFLLGVLLEHKSLKSNDVENISTNQSDNHSQKFFPKPQSNELIQSQQLIIPKENKNSTFSPLQKYP